MNRENTFKSFLKDSLQGYINEKQAVGYSFAKGISMLRVIQQIIRFKFHHYQSK